jgi:hypothetical protein
MDKYEQQHRRSTLVIVIGLVSILWGMMPVYMLIMMNPADPVAQIFGCFGLGLGLVLTMLAWHYTVTQRCTVWRTGIIFGLIVFSSGTVGIGYTHTGWYSLYGLLFLLDVLGFALLRFELRE